MKFLRRRTGRKLHRFGDDIGDVPIGWQPLRQFQEKLIQGLGHELIDIGAEAQVNEPNVFVFDDDLVFSALFVKKAVAAAKNAGEPLRFCLRPNPFNDRFALPLSRSMTDDLKFPFYFRGPGPGDPRDFYIEQDVYENRVRLPRQVMPDGFYSYDQCETFVTQIISPFHLLQANLAFLFLDYIGLRTLLPESFLRRWVPPQSRLFFRALKLKNKIGRNCRIHPTAVLEGCEIGDDVTIGAYSVVRLAKIGTGSTLEEHTVIKYSVLGRETYISNGNQLNGCMTYDEAFLIHGPYQVSIFGAQTSVMAVINCDIRLDQKTIQIETANGILDSRQPFFGIAYGHRAKVGGGNIIPPGRIVPNDYRLAPPAIMKSNFEETREELQWKT